MNIQYYRKKDTQNLLKKDTYNGNVKIILIKDCKTIDFETNFFNQKHKII
jgi:hypothetical protein